MMQTKYVYDLNSTRSARKLQQTEKEKKSSSYKMKNYTEINNREEIGILFSRLKKPTLSKYNIKLNLTVTTISN